MQAQDSSSMLKSTAIIALCAFVAFAFQRLACSSPIGKSAPPLAVSDWTNTNGSELSLSKLQGKVVVLDFWAYW